MQTGHHLVTPRGGDRERSLTTSPRPLEPDDDGDGDTARGIIDAVPVPGARATSHRGYRPRDQRSTMCITTVQEAPRGEPRRDCYPYYEGCEGPWPVYSCDLCCRGQGRTAHRGEHCLVTRDLRSCRRALRTPEPSPVSVKGFSSASSNHPYPLFIPPDTPPCSAVLQRSRHPPETKGRAVYGLTAPFSPSLVRRRGLRDQSATGKGGRCDRALLEHR